MKKLTLIILISISSNILFSQDYMDDIVIKSCECLTKVSDTLELNRLHMELGLCMINASMPYKKELLKDYDIDLNNIDSEGEKLGTMIGLRMAGTCPNELIKLAEQTGELDQEIIENQYVENVTIGEITKIDSDLFIAFTIKDEKGKSSKFYWLTFIESDFDLSDYSTLINKNVSVTYTTQELYDNKIQEYRLFNIISSIKVFN